MTTNEQGKDTVLFSWARGGRLGPRRVERSPDGAELTPKQKWGGSDGYGGDTHQRRRTKMGGGQVKDDGGLRAREFSRLAGKEEQIDFLYGNFVERETVFESSLQFKDEIRRTTPSHTSPTSENVAHNTVSVRFDGEGHH
ncbi:hypothetical protein V6N11_062182 [Hibiscus sabdariffa]|uniref:Uncharacterized protein n=1 Tax=Hibiscus sabdariffa TaxID=183260 RepID=A0ABR2PS40_9ROSI